MRIARLFGVVLTFLVSGLLLATPAGAQPPGKLTEHITDNTGALTDSSRAAVSSAIDRLYRDRHIQLWVVYVDNFSRFKPENWAEKTRSESGMGEHDALLAVATNTKLYTFTAPIITAGELNDLRSRQIEPAVGRKDWSEAAVAAADGLNNAASSSKRNWVPIAIGVAVVVAVLLVVFLLFRARRRKRPARPVDSGQATIEGRDQSLAGALSTADARVRQISDYIARHGKSIGAEAKSELGEAKRQLDAAHANAADSEREAIAYANGASRLAARAQALANADVAAGRRTGG